MRAIRSGVGTWVIFLATLVAMAVAARLGLWQMDRAAQKLDIQNQLDARRKLPPLTQAQLPSTVTEAKAFLHRRVTLRGRWWSEATVYLENRPMKGAVGFAVMTPLRLGDGRVLMVQRGWLPRDPLDRQRIPPFETEKGELAVNGILALDAPRLYELGEPQAQRIRQNLSLSSYGLELRAMAQSAPFELLPWVLLQTDTEASLIEGPQPYSGRPAEPEGANLRLQRALAEPASGVHKHWGYAVQWFGLCALVAVLYVWFQIIRPWRTRKAPRH